MAQQTAVEYLVESLLSIYTNEGLSYNQKAVDAKLVIDKAKAMEREQIINACEHFADYPFEKDDYEEYYNETYTK